MLAQAKSRSTPEAKHTSAIQLELDALRKFYRATGGENHAWVNDSGWPEFMRTVQESSADVLALRGSMESQIRLHGVTWKHNHVVAIDLNENGLRGKLPKELAHLRSLALLKLRGNTQLRGQVPGELYHQPQLRYCYLDGTSLDNVLPHHIAHSFQITQLDTTSRATVTGGRTTRSRQPVATVLFQTGNGKSHLTRWVAQMTEAELFQVHSSLKARHDKPRGVEQDIPRTSHNATGPERAQAAAKLQRIYRARIARTKFRQFLKSLFDRQIDATTGYTYFVDTRTGETMWERPKYIAHTPRSSNDEEKSDNQEDIWQAYDDGAGNTYYWNRTTGETTWEPPAFMSRIYQELRARYGDDKSDDERFQLFFEDIDKDQTGSIDRDEFARLCGELGMAMSTKQIEKVFQELDTSGDGELSREEIVAWLTRNYH